MSEQLPEQGTVVVEEKPPLPPTWFQKIRRYLVGSPRSLTDKGLFHRLSLIPFLAWVGLGADGLSSSSYGPEEAFRTLGEHTYLAVGLALLTAFTVILIAAAYSRIIESFPHGGGGYLVATKLLGERIGLISGCALLVDYVLTIAVSIAASGDALFSFLPLAWHTWKLPSEMIMIVLLTMLNIRGVRESVMVLMPIFILFLITHALAIFGGIAAHATELPSTMQNIGHGFEQGLTTKGLGGMILLFLHAYSMGGGTYTGIEAVSNGMAIMREPRVHTGKRTMVYMAASLAITASGLLLCYLLWQVMFVPGKTMNAVLLERLTQNIPGGAAFVILTLITEGALLMVAAQAGFIDGPRVIANMSIDSWMPRRFGALSERLTTQNGIILMGASSIMVLFHARGDVRQLVVMYSINVFLTFSLSMLGMLIANHRSRKILEHWKKREILFATGFLLCVTILVITAMEKFVEGGWLTFLVTGCLVILCSLIRVHYRRVGSHIYKLYSNLSELPEHSEKITTAPKPDEPTAAVLVAAYGGLGIHNVLTIIRTFPGQFKNFIFISVGVIDSGSFKGEGSLEQLSEKAEEALKKYEELSRKLGFPATYRFSVGMDAVEEAEKLCLQVAKDFPKTTFFGGKIIFQREGWYQRLLHNETALALQNRLFLSGNIMVILPARV